MEKEEEQKKIIIEDESTLTYRNSPNPKLNQNLPLLNKNNNTSINTLTNNINDNNKTFINLRTNEKEQKEKQPNLKKSIISPNKIISNKSIKTNSSIIHKKRLIKNGSYCICPSKLKSSIANIKLNNNINNMNNINQSNININMNEDINNNNKNIPINNISNMNIYNNIINTNKVSKYRYLGHSSSVSELIGNERFSVNYLQKKNATIYDFVLPKVQPRRVIIDYYCGSDEVHIRDFNKKNNSMKKFGKSSSQYMGDSYNPFNYYKDARNKFKRNYYGAVFLN